MKVESLIPPQQQQYHIILSVLHSRHDKHYDSELRGVNICTKTLLQSISA